MFNTKSKKNTAVFKGNLNLNIKIYRYDNKYPAIEYKLRKLKSK